MPSKSQVQSTPEGEVKALSLAIAPLYEEATELEVKTPADYEGAAVLLISLKGRQKELDDKRRSLTRPLDAAKKGIMDLFRPVEERLKTGETVLKRAMLSFQTAEAERHAAEQAKIEAKAESLRAKGKEAQATALVEMAEASEPEPTRVAGVSTRTIWKVKPVVDMEKLVAHCVAIGDYNLIEPNWERLNAFARAGKGTWGVPGVEVISEEIMAAGTGRG